MAKSKPDHAADERPGSRRKYLRTLLLPNSSPVPNFFFDEILSDAEIPHAARSVLLFLIRKTVGWNNRQEELSLDQIQYGAGVSRPIAIHSLWIICDVWGLFHKTRGRKGQHSSVYAIGDLTEDGFQDRYNLVSRIYGTGFPTPEQVRPKGGKKRDKHSKEPTPKELIAIQLEEQRRLRDAEDAEKDEKYRRWNRSSQAN